MLKLKFNSTSFTFNFRRTEMSLTIKDLSKEIDMTAVRGRRQREHLGALSDQTCRRPVFNVISHGRVGRD